MRTHDVVSARALATLQGDFALISKLHTLLRDTLAPGVGIFRAAPRLPQPLAAVTTKAEIRVRTGR